MAENAIQKRLKDLLGAESFGKEKALTLIIERVRDIYEAYSAYSGNTEMMEAHEFQKLLKDYELISERVSKVTTELLFTKKNKNKSCSISFFLNIVSYNRFIEILFEIAKMENAETKNPDHAADAYIRERILKKGIIIDNEVKSKFEQWFVELEGFDIKEFLDTKKQLFANV